jgi:hypothetical protein
VMQKKNHGSYITGALSLNLCCGDFYTLSNQLQMKSKCTHT